MLDRQLDRLALFRVQPQGLGFRRGFRRGFMLASGKRAIRGGEGHSGCGHGPHQRILVVRYSEGRRRFLLPVLRAA